MKEIKHLIQVELTHLRNIPSLGGHDRNHPLYHHIKTYELMLKILEKIEEEKH